MTAEILALTDVLGNLVRFELNASASAPRKASRDRYGLDGAGERPDLGCGRGVQRADPAEYPQCYGAGASLKLNA